MARLDSVPDSVFVELLDNKLSYRDIGAVLRVSAATVCKEIKKRDLCNNRKLIRLSDDELIEFRNRNKTYKEIGEILGVSENTVSAEYRHRGIKISLTSERALANTKTSELRKLREDGLSYRDIAIKFMVSQTVLIREYELRDIKDGNTNYRYSIGDYDSEYLMELRKCGISYEKIAELLDASTVTVHKEYKQRGLKDNQ